MVDIKKLLGKRVRELRKKCGISQEKLAEQIGIEARNLMNIENAKTFPRAATIEKLINFFDIEPTEFFNLTSPPPPQTMLQAIVSALQNDEKMLNLVYKMIAK